MRNPIETERRGSSRDSDGLTLRPFFGYYGGKWRDTPRWYPEPQFNTIVEPFAGSAGYSMRYADRNVVLCELDPIVAEVWDFLINHATAEAILELPDIAADGSLDDYDLPRPVKSLIGFWLNRGVSRPRKSPSRWMREGIRPGSFWGDRVRSTIAAQLQYIRHWRIYAVGFELCPFSKPATWFVDPPYQRAGQHYRYGSDQIDYQALGDWCEDLPGQVIVCEHEGADWLDFEELAKTKTTRKGRRSPEFIWHRPSRNGR